MHFSYGPYQDLRILEEIRFWKLQEAEHTVVIRELAPNLEPRYKTTLEEWEKSFKQTLQVATDLEQIVLQAGGQSNPQIHEKVVQLTQYSIEQSKQFIALLHEIKANSQVAKGNPTVVTVLNHIERESEYFIEVLKELD